MSTNDLKRDAEKYTKDIINEIISMGLISANNTDAVEKIVRKHLTNFSIIKIFDNIIKDNFKKCKEKTQKCDCNDVKSSFDFKQPFDVNKIPISILVDYLDDLSKDISHNFTNIVDEIEYLNERLSNIEKKFD